MGEVMEEIEKIAAAPSLDEIRNWWNEATKKFGMAKMMAEIQFAPYDPQPERILRLIMALKSEAQDGS